MSLFRQAIFFKSALEPWDLPAESRCEVAFAGRSNAGKSSALNTLVGQGRLAFVSKTPGRTQLINYYSLGDDRFLVDLPGYGYAKIAKHARKPWGRLLGDYLHTRSALAGLVLVMDIRHALTELDWGLLEWFQVTGKPMHALLSKADKLSRAEARKVLEEVRRELFSRSPLWSAQLFSSLKRTGIEEAGEVIGAWFGEIPAQSRTPDKARQQHGFRDKKAPGKRGD
ncbi:MAG: YihA family ribosome biogenesis GTP-binding protein [Betaproteobacteria bacterium]|nr:YihA family ribosome biogenesis GTP-binding protein [Betaproteobacteria bacterium]